MSLLFSWLDYTLFILMLLISTIIGIYYGFFQKQTSAKEYLLGGKNMNVWPISLSLVSSCVSGVPLLTFPTEIYSFGISTALVTFEMAIIFGSTYFIFLPVFYQLQVTSMYEYFQLRFDKSMRILASVLYTIYMALYLPLVIYVPSLALSQVTGIAAGVLSPILCGICIFYTTLGGLKAVVWTDALQFFFMIGSMLVVVVVGTIHAGGIENLWKLASDNGRLDLTFELDPTIKDSFWSGAVGFLFVWFTVVSLNQGTIQKCMSLSSYKEVKKALLTSWITLSILLFFVFFTGLTMYAKYFDCDPLASNKIQKRDQMVPYFVMDVSKNIPGLAGLFIAGILSAALSTLSAGMNCLGATIYEDFLKPFLGANISDKKTSLLLKLIVAAIGVICTALVYAVEQLGNVLPLVLSVFGVAGGPILGIFTVGMMVPMVNSIGALIGGIVSLVVMSWIVVGTHIYRTTHPYSLLPISTDGCPLNGTLSALNTTAHVFVKDDGFFLFRLSPNYYTLMGFLIVVVLSVVISFLFKKRNTIVDKDCITPFMQFLLPKTEMYFPVEEIVKLTDKDNEYNKIQL
ncbi:sodium-coupled monocarboxylate transporter 2-like [Onthophagus taurus]|uniref:sodium-coupled monocarboxylate transporter 2-like n=1 Tax=Onthophagus taurus TaxID=166361 RepID=UPI0039BDE600